MRTYKVKTVDGRLFYVAHWNKGEAVTFLRDNEGITARSVKRVNVVHNATDPGVIEVDTDDVDAVANAA